MEPQLRKNEQTSRYEAVIDDEVAGYIDYSREGDVVDMPHTVVEENHQGKGVAGLLAAYALGDAAGEGLKVRPTCPYLARYIERRPELHGLRASD